jgi:hypothetical protein
MRYKGHVQNGAVILDDAPDLPDGAEVEVELTQPQSKFPTLRERLARLAGRVDGLPEDLAENHDHYLHGRPKR